MNEGIQAIDCLCDDEITEYEVLMALRNLFEKIQDKKEISMGDFDEVISSRLKDLKWEIGNRLLQWYRMENREKQVIKEIIQ